MNVNNDLTVSGVSKIYGSMKALDNVSYTFSQGQHYAITGASGSGKSTLLYLLGGLEHPTHGKILLGNVALEKLSDEELAKFRNRQVGFVFQFHFLLSSMTCLENIMITSQIAGAPRDEIIKFVHEMADKLNITHCLKKFPFQLSGGEQQRVNIIRALTMKPKLLLCDEPTGNLDSKNSDTVIDLLQSLAMQFKATLILVTHDLAIAGRFQNHIHLSDGKIDQ